MKWSKLIDSNKLNFQRGELLKFKASYPFEDHVVMKLCEGQSTNTFGLITITGFKAGINLYVQFPEECVENGLSVNWLIKNWNYWVCPESDVNEVLVHENLQVSDL